MCGRAHHERPAHRQLCEASQQRGRVPIRRHRKLLLWLPSIGNSVFDCFLRIAIQRRSAPQDGLQVHSLLVSLLACLACRPTTCHVQKLYTHARLGRDHLTQLCRLDRLGSAGILTCFSPATANPVAQTL